jgi:hypothetical protein
MGHRSLDVLPNNVPTLGPQQAWISHHPQGVVLLAGIVTLTPGTVLWGATLGALSMMNPWLQMYLPRQRRLSQPVSAPITGLAGIFGTGHVEPERSPPDTTSWHETMKASMIDCGSLETGEVTAIEVASSAKSRTPSQKICGYLEGY